MPGLVAGIQHALVERSIDRINRKQWMRQPAVVLPWTTGLEERDFSFQVSSRLFQRTRTNVSSGHMPVPRPCGRPFAFPLSLSETAWLRSLLYFPVFLQKTPRAAAQRKTRRGMPPGLMV
jgi:hypothetical protein